MKRTRKEIESDLIAARKAVRAYKKERYDLDHFEAWERRIQVPWETFVEAAGESNTAWKKVKSLSYQTCIGRDRCYYWPHSSIDVIDLCRIKTIRRDGRWESWDVCNECYEKRGKLLKKEKNDDCWLDIDPVDWEAELIEKMRQPLKY